MFITIGSIAQHVSDMAGHVLLASGDARISTAGEAAECVSRYVINGDPKMHEANENFKEIYGNKSEGANES